MWDGFALVSLYHSTQNECSSGQQKLCDVGAFCSISLWILITEVPSSTEDELGVETDSVPSTKQEEVSEAGQGGKKNWKRERKKLLPDCV